MNFTNELSISSNLVSNVAFYRNIASYIYYLAYSINALLGIPMNSYVLWLICTGKGRGIDAEFFSLNLSVCEILFSLTGLVIFLANKSLAVLYIRYFSVALSTVGRPLFTCVICIERYLAVLHPVSFLKYKPLKYRLACSAVIWSMILGFGVVFVLVLLSNNIHMFICLYLPLFSVLLSIKFFCCLTIIKALKYPCPGEKGKERKQANHMKKKAVVMILTITVTMFLQYTPLIFIGLLYSTLTRADIFMSIGVAIFIMFGYVSPILYICRG